MINCSYTLFLIVNYNNFKNLLGLCIDYAFSCVINAKN